MTLEDHRAAMLLTPYAYRGPIPDHFQDDLREAMIFDARQAGHRPRLPAARRPVGHRPMTDKGRVAREMAAAGASTAEITKATGVHPNYARTLRAAAGFGNSPPPRPRSKSDDARDLLRAGKAPEVAMLATGLARKTIDKLAREVRA